MADDILGPTVGINAQSAADVLAQRIAQVGQEASAAHPSDNGKTLFSAPASAGDTFDAAAYDQQLAAQRLRVLGETAPRSGSGPPEPVVQLSAIEQRMPYEANYASRVADPRFMVSTDPAVNELAPQNAGRTFESHREALDLTQDLTTDLNNRYAQTGRLGDIGSKEYHADRQSILVSAGLMNAPAEEGRGGIFGNMAKDWAEPYGKLNYGYASLQLMQGAGSDYAKTNVGQYVSPEEQETANAGLLPGVGAIAGTAIGSMIAPGVGSWVGGMIGGGLGSIGQSVVGANETREQSTRETAERLSAALGEAASSVSAFKSQIEATGAPVQQLGQSLAAAGSVGTFGGGSVAGIGALTNAFRENAGTDFAEIAKYTSNPLLASLGNRFSSGAAGQSDLQSLGFDAAENGDFGGLKQFQQMARDASGKNDPQYQAAAARLNKDKENPIFVARNWFNGLAINKYFGGDGVQDGDYIAGAQKQMDDREAALSSQADPAVAAQNALINQFAALRSSTIVSEAGIKSATAGISLSVAQGGSAADIGAASQSLYGSLGAARTATQSEIGLLQSDLANPVNAGRADDLRARIATAQAQLTGYDVTEAQSRRSVFGTGLSEEQSNFSVFATRDALRGDSAASLLGGYNRQAEFLSGVAADPRNPLSPTERSSVEESALRMRFSAAQSVYGEENAALGITRAGREAGISRAALLGTPQDGYNAQIAGLQSDRDQIAQNSSELSRGNLTYSQRLGLQAQNVGLQANLDTSPERARLSAYASEAGILSDTQSAERAGLSRSVSISGASAFTPQVFADDQARIDLANGGQSGSRPGTAAYSRFGAEAAAGREALLSDRTQSQIYRETSEQRIQDMTVSGAFERSLKAPYMDGNPDSNPMTAGRAQLSNLQSRLGGAEAALRGATDPLAREQDTAIVERYKDQIAGLEQERRTGFLKFLPEMIAGSPGQGNLAGVLPTPGQSAFYGGNPFVSGTFGRPNTGSAGGSGLVSQAGGEAGGFLSASGASSGIAQLTAELKRLNDNVTRGNIGGRSAATTGQPSGYSQNVNLGTNPYRAGG